MTIAIVGTPAYQHYDSFVENAHTLSVTVPSGAEVLLIGVTINNDVWSQLTSLTFNGTSVGAHVGTTPNSVANRSCRWYAVTSPAAGTFNIVATYSTSSNNKGGMVAVCLTGVNTGSLIADAQASSTGSGSSPLSTSVTSPSGAVAFAACYADTQQPTPTSGQTTLGANESNHCFSYKLDATAMGATFTGSPQIAQAVVVIKPAGGGDVTAPVITGPGGATGSTSSKNIAENQTVVHTFSADESVTWSLNGGADVAFFAINSSTGALAFLSGRDYETPADTGANNTYVVGVRATDGSGNATTQTLTVTITDVAEGGAGTLTIPLDNNTGHANQAGVVIPKVLVSLHADMSQVLNLTNQTVDGSSNLVISHAAIVAGQGHVITGVNADGTKAFVYYTVAT